MLEDFFNECIFPHFNPPITDPIVPILVQIEPIPVMYSLVPTSNIPMVTSGPWYFWGIFSPQSLPSPTISPTPLIGYHATHTIPSPRNLVTLAMSRVKYLPITIPCLLAVSPQPVTPSSGVSTVSFNKPFGWNPLLSYNPRLRC